MQDSYSDFIMESMRQAQSNYESDSELCGCCEQSNISVQQEDVNVPAMVFIAMQPFGRLYNEAEGLCRGTIFPALDKPFLGRGGMCCGR